MDELKEKAQDEAKNTGSGGKTPDLGSISKNYVAWVTASAFSALSTLFGILYFVQNKAYDTARKDLAEEKMERKYARKSDSLTISNLRQDLVNCDDLALEDLEKKMETAKRLKVAATADYAKISKEIEITQQNAAELSKAANAVNKAIETQQ